jgi:hypothetical protein
MMKLADVATYAASLPGVVVGTKYGRSTWMVGDAGFAWQRPFSKADIKRFGDEMPPAGDIIAVKVQNLDAKDALLAMELPGFFTIPHFNGYAAVLIALRKARSRDVRAAILDAWRTVAPSEAPGRARARRPGRNARGAAARRNG